MSELDVHPSVESEARQEADGRCAVQHRQEQQIAVGCHVMKCIISFTCAPEVTANSLGQAQSMHSP